MQFPFLHSEDGLPNSAARMGNTRRWFDWVGSAEIDGPAPEETQAPTAEPAGQATAPPEWLAPRGYDRDPDTLRAGSVRLLSPLLAASDADFVCLLVLGEWAPGYPLVAPFSPYPDPATEKELATGLKQDRLRVLQLWNARSVPVDVLSEGWKIDTVPDSLVDEARALHRSACLAQASIPENLLPRVGLRIQSPEDPRRGYVRRGIEALAPLWRASLAWAEMAGGMDLPGHATASDPSEAHEKIIRFPAALADRVPALSQLAAAADGQSIRCLRLKQTFGHWLAGQGMGGSLSADMLGGASAFAAEVLLPVIRSSPQQLGPFGSFRPEAKDLPSAMPFLVIEQSDSGIVGLGRVDADGNLELSTVSETLATGPLSRFLLILPAR